MSEKTADRRTIKTRRAICEALSELLTEKELHKVTVQEIADKADVNRVTFYKHYLDVYDLYDKIEQDILVEIGLLTLQLEELSSNEFCRKMIEYIDENKTAFKMMFCPNSTGKLRDKFSKCLEGLFLKMESEKQDIPLNDVGLAYKTCYRVQGSIAVLSKWVLSNFSDPKDLITKLMAELDMNTEKVLSKK